MSLEQKDLQNNIESREQDPKGYKTIKWNSYLYVLDNLWV